MWSFPNVEIRHTGNLHLPSEMAELNALPPLHAPTGFPSRNKMSKVVSPIVKILI